MKTNDVIIVEGKSDKILLESFIDGIILTTNGQAVDGFSKDYLIELSKTHKIITLTDPDYPGMYIRNEIEKIVPNCFHAFVNKKNCIKHHKVGVAESSKDEILTALDNIISASSLKVGTLTLNDMLKLSLVGENSKENKNKVIDYYRIGVCNSKTMLKRLNILNVKYEELEKIINDCD